MKFNSYIEYLTKSINDVNNAEVEQLINVLYGAYEKGKMVFIIGNGGSAANASHFAEDLAKGTIISKEQEKRIKALSLTDNLPFLSAVSNDDGYENAFLQQLITFASPGDLLIAISGSGNSPNIIKAIEWANENGLDTIGISGFDGGKLKQMNKYSLHVPLNDMCSVESIHSVIFHYVVLELQKHIKTHQLQAV